MNKAIGRDGLRPLIVFAACVDLKEHAELNGQRVAVYGFAPESNEYSVHALSDLATELAIMSANLIFSPGSAVGVIGLLGAPELNGTQGVIDEFDAAAGRYIVLLESPKRSVRLRPGNCRAYFTTADEKFYALMGEAVKLG